VEGARCMEVMAGGCGVFQLLGDGSYDFAGSLVFQG